MESPWVKVYIELAAQGLVQHRIQRSHDLLYDMSLRPPDLSSARTVEALSPS